LARLMREKEVWSEAPDATGTRAIPIEALVMACLKVLGRAQCFDDAGREFGISEPTLQRFYHVFSALCAQQFQQNCGPSRSPEALAACMGAYALRGLPGCIGSTDVIHITWDRCPANQRNMRVRGKFPTVAYQVCSERCLIVANPQRNGGIVFSLIIAIAPSPNPGHRRPYSPHISCGERRIPCTTQVCCFDNNDTLVMLHLRR